MPKQNAESRELWRQFYSAEQEFLSYVETNSQCLHQIEGYEPAYIKVETKKGIIEKPPRWIRWIGLFEGNVEKLLENRQTLLAKHAAAVEDCDNKKRPVRFLQYFENLAHVAISVNPAHQSISVESGRDITIQSIAIWKKEDLPAAKKTLSQSEATLRQHGFKVVSQSIEMRLLGQKQVLMAILRVSGEEILNHTKSQRLQARKSTGQQYTAGIATHNNQAIKRIHFGFILTKDSSCNINFSTPRKPRSNTIEAVAEQVSLPVYSDFVFWRLE